MICIKNDLMGSMLIIIRFYETIWNITLINGVLNGPYYKEKPEPQKWKAHINTCQCFTFVNIIWLHPNEYGAKSIVLVIMCIFWSHLIFRNQCQLI